MRKHFKAHHNIGAFGHIECEDDLMLDDGENLAVNSPMAEKLEVPLEEMAGEEPGKPISPTIQPQQPKSRRKSVPVRKVTQLGADNLSFDGAQAYSMGIAV